MRSLTTATRPLVPFVPTLLRLSLGIVMAVHGYQKLTQMTPGGFATGMLAGLGVPLPLVAAWAITLIELVGGVALLVGLATRLAAALNAVVLVGATLLVKTDLGLIAGTDAPLPGAELDIALAALATAVVVLGPGRLALDTVIGIEQDAVVVLPEHEAERTSMAT